MSVDDAGRPLRRKHDYEDEALRPRSQGAAQAPPGNTTGGPMGWETRTRGGVYYTRSRKVGGRVVREYVGAAGSPTAEVAAAEDALRREDRERVRQEALSLREADAQAEQPLAELSALGQALLEAALLVTGYHRHDRGPWRRRRA